MTTCSEFRIFFRIFLNIFFSLWGGKCSEESNFTLLSEIMKTFFHWITKIWLFSHHKQQRRKISLVVGHTHLHCLVERKNNRCFFTLFHSLLSWSSHLIFICKFILWVCFFLFHSKSIYQNWPERISIQMRRAYVTNRTIANDAWYAGDDTKLKWIQFNNNSGIYQNDLDIYVWFNRKIPLGFGSILFPIPSPCSIFPAKAIFFKYKIFMYFVSRTQC